MSVRLGVETYIDAGGDELMFFLSFNQNSFCIQILYLSKIVLVKFGKLLY